jgi:Ser/Thr protein kinase RdoA (MazF antagonist)
MFPERGRLANLIRYAPRELVASALAPWSGERNTLTHLGDSGNSVYSFRRGTETLILRVTDGSIRTYGQLRAETDFLEYLRSQEVAVAYPVPATGGEWVVDLASLSGPFFVSVFSFAPGVRVDPGGEHWGRELATIWGRSLAEIHRASRIYRPGTAFRRWRWEEEIWVASAKTLIPGGDTESIHEFDRVMAAVRRFPQDGATFGLVHGDHGPQNFHFARATRSITTFDFGNCCYHWYLADLAVALTLLRGRPDSDEMLAGLLGGYGSILPLAPGYEAQLDWLIRLRALYVYLSRLFAFGDAPNPGERGILETLRRRVHQAGGW